MSTTPNFSNFISNFTDLSNIDIVSSVSGSVVQSGDSMVGRYFCIGNLLIQFNDNNSFPNQNIGGYQISFPIAYDATPYTVMLTGTDINNNNQVTATLKAFGKTNFSVEIDTNQGWFNFVAIGPRPSSLYTA